MPDNVVPFRTKRLTGFLPENDQPPAPEKLPAVVLPAWPRADPVVDDRSPCEMPPESADT
jgi:hypothetical protein